jgi:hypothetical protein
MNASTVTVARDDVRREKRLLEGRLDVVSAFIVGSSQLQREMAAVRGGLGFADRSVAMLAGAIVGELLVAAIVDVCSTSLPRARECSWVVRRFG